MKLLRFILSFFKKKYLHKAPHEIFEQVLFWEPGDSLEKYKKRIIGENWFRFGKFVEIIDNNVIYEYGTNRNFESQYDSIPLKKFRKKLKYCNVSAEYRIKEMHRDKRSEEIKQKLQNVDKRYTEFLESYRELND